MKYECFKDRIYQSPLSLIIKIASTEAPSGLLKSSYQSFKSLVKSVNSQPLILNIGSGGQRITTSATRYLGDLTLVNVDIQRLPTVHVIGDAHRLPFRDNFFDGAIIDGVLEHMQKPVQVVDEIHRVLKVGGIVYAKVPFMQAFHARPSDFQRYTLPGLIYLFGRFYPIDKGVAKGPSAVLRLLLSEYLAIYLSFGIYFIYEILRDIFSLALLWIKLLDMPLVKTKRWNKLLEILPQDVFLIATKQEESNRNVILA